MSFWCLQFSQKRNENNSTWHSSKVEFFRSSFGIRKRHFEINWPLGFATTLRRVLTNNCFTLLYPLWASKFMKLNLNQTFSTNSLMNRKTNFGKNAHDMCKLFLCSEVLCFRFRFANWSKGLWWTKVWQNVYLWLDEFFYVDYSWLKYKNVKGLHCGIVTQIVHTLIQTCPLFFSRWQKGVLLPFLYL